MSFDASEPKKLMMREICQVPLISDIMRNSEYIQFPLIIEEATVNQKDSHQPHLYTRSAKKGGVKSRIRKRTYDKTQLTGFRDGKLTKACLFSLFFSSMTERYHSNSFLDMIRHFPRFL